MNNGEAEVLLFSAVAIRSSIFGDSDLENVFRQDYNPRNFGDHIQDETTEEDAKDLPITSKQAQLPQLTIASSHHI